MESIEGWQGSVVKLFLWLGLRPNLKQLEDLNRSEAAGQIVSGTSCVSQKPGRGTILSGCPAGNLITTLDNIVENGRIVAKSPIQGRIDVALPGVRQLVDKGDDACKRWRADRSAAD